MQAQGPGLDCFRGENGRCRAPHVLPRTWEHGLVPSPRQVGCGEQAAGKAGGGCSAPFPEGPGCRAEVGGGAAQPPVGAEPRTGRLAANQEAEAGVRDHVKAFSSPRGAEGPFSAAVSAGSS